MCRRERRSGSALLSPHAAGLSQWAIAYPEEHVKHLRLRVLNRQRRFPRHEVGELRGGQLVDRDPRDLDPRRAVGGHL